MMKAILEINDPSGIVSTSDFKRLTEKALKFLKQPGNYTVSLAIVDDAEIKDLNKCHRQQNKATDVLSFPFLFGENVDVFPPMNGRQDLGEVVIAHETARRQAQEKGGSLKEELRVLYVHGLLHLLGYDHQSARQRQTVAGLTERILNS